MSPKGVEPGRDKRVPFFLIAWDRPYDGAHWPSDVVGAVLGAGAPTLTYYEAGDVNKLLGLYDASSVGLWEALNLRNDFEEFFRSTRTRRLRLQGVSVARPGRTSRFATSPALPPFRASSTSAATLPCSRT